MLLAFSVWLLIAGIACAAVSPAEVEKQKVVELNQLAEKNISSNPAQALDYATEAAKQAVESKDRKGQALALLNMGLAHLQLGNLPEVRKNLEESLTVAQQAEDIKGQGDAYNFLGTYFWEEGLYDQALKNYSKALELRTGLGDRIGMSKSINNLGLVYRQIGNYETAVDYFRQSLDMKGSGDFTGRSNTLTNMANTYKEKRNYAEALQIMEQALAVATGANYPQGQAFARRSMGEVQLEMRLLPAALENLRQAAVIYEKISYLKGEAFTLYTMGRVYEEQGSVALAMETYSKAMGIAGRIGQKKLLGDLYYHFARVSKESQDWAGAFEYYEKSVQLGQEISKEEIRQRAVLQKISYDADKKQHEIDFLKTQAERQELEARNRNNLLLAALSSLIFFGFLAAYLRQQLSFKHKKEQELLAVTQRLEAASEQLNQMAETDYLTDVANRRSFDSRYQEEYIKAGNEEKTLSVIMVDIDLFKQYNDLYGHQQGDDCLKLVAKSLQAVVGGTECLLARYGGEEFVIVAKMNLAQSVELSEQARQFIAQLNYAHSGSPFKRVTCSFGVASKNDFYNNSPENLLKSADQALYQAKLHGRNRVCSSP